MLQKNEECPHFLRGEWMPRTASLPIFLERGADATLQQQIYASIRECILDGRVTAEHRLPSTRTLAAELKVNVNTVQHAYRVLAREGTVYIKRGTGTFVSPTAKAPSDRQAVTARRIAEKMLREAFRHGLLASDLIAALKEIAPERAQR